MIFLLPGHASPWAIDSPADPADATGPGRADWQQMAEAAKVLADAEPRQRFRMALIAGYSPMESGLITKWSRTGEWAKHLNSVQPAQPPVKHKLHSTAITTGVNAMPRVSEMQDYQSKFLKAADLGGRACRVRIATATGQAMRQQDGTTQHKIVLSFVGKSKQLVLNKTNAQNLAMGLGDDSDDWAGAEIVLTPARSNSGIDMITCMAIPNTDGSAPKTNMQRQPQAQQRATAPAPQRAPVAVQAGTDDWPDRDWDNVNVPAGDDGEADQAFF